MKSRRNYLLWIIGCMIVMTSLMAHTPNDSIYTLRHVMRVHLAYPDSAAHLLKTMESRGLEPKWLIQSVYGVVCMSQEKYQLAADFARRALQNDSLLHSPRHYLHTLIYLLEANRRLGRYKDCLEIVEEGLRCARQQGDKTSEANFLFSFGRVCHHQGNKERAYQIFRQAVETCQTDDKPHMKATLGNFYEKITEFLAQDGRLKEALEYSEKWEKIVSEMKHFQKGPLGYVDHEQASLYIQKAYLLEKMGRTQEAFHYYQKYLQTDVVAMHGEHKEYVAHYWLLTKQYRKIIDLLGNEKVTADTINGIYLRKLDYMAQAYRGIRDYEKAFYYQKRHDLVTDSLNLKLKLDAITELTAVYNLHEKNWLIQQQETRIKHAVFVRNLMIFAFLLVCALFGIWYYHLRTVQKKNRLMVATLDTVQTYQQKIQSLEQHLSIQRKEMDVDADVDMQVFRRFEKLMQEEELYLQSDLTRQDLLDYLCIDKNYFSKLLQKYVQMSLPQYLTNLRINHAIRQLKKHPNYTIQAISDASGFTNVRHFQRSFKTVTGMTPSEYKIALTTRTDL